MDMLQYCDRVNQRFHINKLEFLYLFRVMILSAQRRAKNAFRTIDPRNDRLARLPAAIDFSWIAEIAAFDDGRRRPW
jgi:hypothetical protein